MTPAKAGLLALALTTGCLRFGYEATRAKEMRDAAPNDAGVVHVPDSSVFDAAVYARDAAVGGSGGSAGEMMMAAAGRGGTAGHVPGGAGAMAGSSGMAGGAGAGAWAEAGTAGGTVVDEPIGETGLHVSDILGYYSGDWGDMVLRRYDTEIWGVYQLGDGTIIGQIRADGVFAGWWTQLPTRSGLDAGDVEFVWAPKNGTVEISGRWRYGASGTWFPNWDVELVTDREAPSSLTQEFDNVADFRRHP